VRPGDGVPERFWNIGVRIEDDALVTTAGCEIFTGGAPKRVDDVEALMRDLQRKAPLPREAGSKARRGAA
jgi:Xaa-Pro aminopeptidase